MFVKLCSVLLARIMRLAVPYSTHLTTSAALSAAGEITRVCGVPFSSEDFGNAAPLSGVKDFRNAGS